MDEECRRITRHRVIVFRERRSSATFRNPQALEFITSKIDGCLLKEVRACDWALSQANNGDVLIELKGRDVDHALEQISETAEFWWNSCYRNGRLAFLIVCRQYPGVDTRVQRAKQRFARLYRAPLHVNSRNREYDFEVVLSF